MNVMERDQGEARLHYLDSSMRSCAGRLCCLRRDRLPSFGCAALLERGPAGSLCQPGCGHGAGAGKGPRSEMRRRRFLIGASLSFAASPTWSQAEKPARFSVTGALAQGSLALGSAPPGSLVALDGRPLRITADGRFAFGFGPIRPSRRCDGALSGRRRRQPRLHSRRAAI